MSESDLTAKARRAAEWFNATQDKTRDTYEVAALESDGWSVYMFYRYGETAHDNACRYDGMPDLMMIAFCKDRGWQDTEADESHRYNECSGCLKRKPDVKWVADPYDEDVNNETVMKFLCDECYKNYCDDI